ncbi:hypothetical protein F5887DRAFT_972075 [Amanita rubescens]|nr:hypothetical protein F5887DRAFT_972075 [Amanita rubescens]
MTTAVSFPAELVNLIVRFLWSYRLSINERVAFMTSIPFFNSAWRNAYIRASTEDVYIPCASYVDHFLSILRRESRFYDKETQARFEARCRTITFVIAHPHVPQEGSTTEHPAGIAMADVLRFITDKKISYVPNLRKIAIHYHNMPGFDDIFEHSRLADFPSQVTELEIVHTFSPAMPDFLVSRLRRVLPILDGDLLSLSWSMPNIRHLTLAGVGGCYVADMVNVCRNIVDLELDLSYGPLREIHTAGVPNSLQRLIIHAPGDVNPGPFKESLAGAHVERLPDVHFPSREICLLPGVGGSYASGDMKALDHYSYLILYYYPANLETPWSGWYD